MPQITTLPCGAPSNCSFTDSDGLNAMSHERVESILLHQESTVPPKKFNRSPKKRLKSQTIKRSSSDMQCQRPCSPGAMSITAVLRQMRDIVEQAQSRDLETDKLAPRLTRSDSMRCAQETIMSKSLNKDEKTERLSYHQINTTAESNLLKFELQNAEEVCWTRRLWNYVLSVSILSETEKYLAAPSSWLPRMIFPTENQQKEVDTLVHREISPTQKQFGSSQTEVMEHKLTTKPNTYGFYREITRGWIVTARGLLWILIVMTMLTTQSVEAAHIHHHRHRTVNNANDPLIVHTTKGPVRGVTQQAANGKLVDAFLGIPYAKPPLGKLRFRHPVPMDPWDQPLNCTEPPPTCVQTVDTFFGDFQGATMWNANTNMTEDCLTMLVWVPRPRPKDAAVLLWIYGGGFYSGTATLDVYDGKTLASEENIIVVSFNYRVASLGFLYLDHADAPGNAGMMDQVQALRWVQDNIRFFGGNPNNVTIFGESAGAVSVSYHLLSPLSRDLFSQAILQSGGATVPWGYHDRQTAMSNGYKLAAQVSCPTDDVDSTIKCLRNQDPTLLVNSEIFASGVVDFSFIPVVDGAFLAERPEDSLNSGSFKKCRILLGSNRDEGTFFIIYYLTHLFKRDENVYLTREDFVDAVQSLNPFASPVVNEAIIFEYTDWLNPDDPIKNRDAVDKIVGDYHFTCPVIDMAHYFSSAGLDVYMYYFIHRSSQNKWPEWMGVIHADEIAYIFGEPLNQTWSYRQDEQLFSKRIMRYWANFARMGNPSLNSDGNWEKAYWPAHTAFGKEYLILDVNSTQVGYGNRAKHCAFWKKYIPNLMAMAGNPINRTDADCYGTSSSKSMQPFSMLIIWVLSSITSLVSLSFATGGLLGFSTAQRVRS